MATIYARLVNQYKFKYHTLFSTRVYKIVEIELIKNLNINHNLTETDINIIDVKSELEHQFQIQQTKESGGMFDKNDS